MNTIDKQIKQLQRNKKVFVKLESRKTRLEAALAIVIANIAKINGTPVATVKPRVKVTVKRNRKQHGLPHGSITALAQEAIQAAGKPLTVVEVATGIFEAHKSEVKNVDALNTSVKNVLYTNGRAFCLEGKGCFSLAKTTKKLPVKAV